MKRLKEIGKFILLAILWLFVSPLYIVVRTLGYKKKLSTSIGFAILSPSTWVLLLCAIFYGYVYFEHRKLTGKKELSQITGIEIPAFRIVEKELGSIAFIGDYSDEFVIEFKELPNDSFYASLDSICKADEYWSKVVKDGKTQYHYSRMWGNGMEAPEGQSPEDDYSLSLSIIKGEQQAELRKGSW